MKRFKFSKDFQTFKAGNVLQFSDGDAERLEAQGLGVIVDDRTACVKQGAEDFDACRPIPSKQAAKKAAKHIQPSAVDKDTPEDIIEHANNL